MSGVKKVVCCLTNMLIPAQIAIEVKSGGKVIGFMDETRINEIGITDWSEGVNLDHLEKPVQKKFQIRI